MSRIRNICVACIVGCACALVGSGGSAQPQTEPEWKKELKDMEKRLSQELAERDAPLIGTVVAFAGDTPPKGWLVCDGSAVDASTYPDLEKILGKRFGERNGKGLLPDLRGRVPFGAGSGSTLSSRKLGEAGGAEQQTLSVAQMPSHSHGVTDPGHGHGINDPGHKHRLPTGDGDAGRRDYAADGDNPKGTYTDAMNNAGTGITIQSATTGISINSTGGGQPVSIVPPFQVVTFIIKAR